MRVRIRRLRNEPEPTETVRADVYTDATDAAGLSAEIPVQVRVERRAIGELCKQELKLL
jgi:hypothetical protein